MVSFREALAVQVLIVHSYPWRPILFATNYHERAPNHRHSDGHWYEDAPFDETVKHGFDGLLLMMRNRYW